MTSTTHIANPDIKTLNQQSRSRYPVVLGLDPALASIGYASIQADRPLDYGIITTDKTQRTSDRLASIYQDIQDLIALLQPDIVGVEHPFFTAANSNAIVVQHATGVIRLALHASGFPDPVFLHQSQVKAAVCKGNAKKPEVKAAVCQIFNLTADDVRGMRDDAIDALAIAYATQQGVSANVHHHAG